jgi:predicted nucleic acid binding AN1-type Zn finger protein
MNTNTKKFKENFIKETPTFKRNQKNMKQKIFSCQIDDCTFKYRKAYECKFCNGHFCDAHYIFKHSKCIECYKKSHLKFIPTIELN